VIVEEEEAVESAAPYRDYTDSREEIAREWLYGGGGDGGSRYEERRS